MKRRTFIQALAGCLPVAVVGAVAAQEPTPPPVEQMTLVAGEFIQPFPTQPTTRLRVWKLGSLEHKILPTPAAIQKLADLLVQWDGKSDLDIIWGPELTVEQFDVGPGGIDVVGGPTITINRAKP